MISSILLFSANYSTGSSEDMISHKKMSMSTQEVMLNNIALICVLFLTGRWRGGWEDRLYDPAYLVSQIPSSLWPSCGRYTTSSLQSSGQIFPGSWVYCSVFMCIHSNICHTCTVSTKKNNCNDFCKNLRYVILYYLFSAVNMHLCNRKEVAV